MQPASNPHFREVWSSTQDNLESAVGSAYSSWTQFENNYLGPCFSSVSGCFSRTGEGLLICFGLDDETQHERQRQNRVKRARAISEARRIGELPPDAQNLKYGTTIEGDAIPPRPRRTGSDLRTYTGSGAYPNSGGPSGITGASSAAQREYYLKHNGRSGFWSKVFCLPQAPQSHYNSSRRDSFDIFYDTYDDNEMFGRDELERLLTTDDHENGQYYGYDYGTESSGVLTSDDDNQERYHDTTENSDDYYDYSDQYYDDEDHHNGDYEEEYHDEAQCKIDPNDDAKAGATTTEHDTKLGTSSEIIDFPHPKPDLKLKTQGLSPTKHALGKKQKRRRKRRDSRRVISQEPTVKDEMMMPESANLDDSGSVRHHTRDRDGKHRHGKGTAVHSKKKQRTRYSDMAGMAVEAPVQEPLLLTMQPHQRILRESQSRLSRFWKTVFPKSTSHGYNSSNISRRSTYQESPDPTTLHSFRDIGPSSWWPTAWLHDHRPAPGTVSQNPSTSVSRVASFTDNASLNQNQNQNQLALYDPVTDTGSADNFNYTYRINLIPQYDMLTAAAARRSSSWGSVFTSLFGRGSSAAPDSSDQAGTIIPAFSGETTKQTEELLQEQYQERERRHRKPERQKGKRGGIVGNSGVYRKKKYSGSSANSIGSATSMILGSPPRRHPRTSLPLPSKTSSQSLKGPPFNTSAYDQRRGRARSSTKSSSHSSETYRSRNDLLSDVESVDAQMVSDNFANSLVYGGISSSSGASVNSDNITIDFQADAGTFHNDLTDDEDDTGGDGMTIRNSSVDISFSEPTTAKAVNTDTRLPGDFHGNDNEHGSSNGNNNSSSRFLEQEFLSSVTLPTDQTEQELRAEEERLEREEEALARKHHEAALKKSKELGLIAGERTNTPTSAPMPLQSLGPLGRSRSSTNTKTISGESSSDIKANMAPTTKMKEICGDDTTSSEEDGEFGELVDYKSLTKRKEGEYYVRT